MQKITIIFKETHKFNAVDLIVVVDILFLLLRVQLSNELFEIKVWALDVNYTQKIVSENATLQLSFTTRTGLHNGYCGHGVLLGRVGESGLLNELLLTLIFELLLLCILLLLQRRIVRVAVHKTDSKC